MTGDPEAYCSSCGAQRPPGAAFCSSCGHPFDAESGGSAAVAVNQGISLPAGAIVAGGLLAVLGSFLPWVTATAALVGTISRSGMEGGDGIVTLLLGVAAGLVGFSRLRGPTKATVWLGPLLLGLAIAGLGAFEIIIIQDRLKEVDSEVGTASVGMGPWAIAVGGVLVVAGALKRDGGGW